MAIKPPTNGDAAQPQGEGLFDFQLIDIPTNMVDLHSHLKSAELDLQRLWNLLPTSITRESSKLHLYLRGVIRSSLIATESVHIIITGKTFDEYEAMIRAKEENEGGPH